MRPTVNPNLNDEPFAIFHKRLLPCSLILRDQPKLTTHAGNSVIECEGENLLQLFTTRDMTTLRSFGEDAGSFSKFYQPTRSQFGCTTTPEVSLEKNGNEVALWFLLAMWAMPGLVCSGEAVGFCCWCYFSTRNVLWRITCSQTSVKECAAWISFCCWL